VKGIRVDKKQTSDDGARARRQKAKFQKLQVFRQMFYSINRPVGVSKTTEDFEGLLTLQILAAPVARARQI
jgi:hypothetical protein